MCLRFVCVRVCDFAITRGDHSGTYYACAVPFASPSCTVSQTLATSQRGRRLGCSLQRPQPLPFSWRSRLLRERGRCPTVHPHVPALEYSRRVIQRLHLSRSLHPRTLWTSLHSTAATFPERLTCVSSTVIQQHYVAIAMVAEIATDNR